MEREGLSMKRLALLFLLLGFVWPHIALAVPPAPPPGSVVDCTAYGSDWNGVTGVAACQDAVYDKIESLAGGHDAVTVTGDALVLSTQDLSVQAYLENLADFTDPNADRLFGFDDTTGTLIGTIRS